MLVDFLDPCPTCKGSNMARSWDEDHWFCPDCVGGRVVSESVIEEMGRAILREVKASRKDGAWWPQSQLIGVSADDLARAVARVVLEHMEDRP